MIAGGAVDAFDVFDGVAQLVDKSLVVADRDGEGTRYRLLETIRQYALERLDDSGETDAVRRRHAEWCADFATPRTTRPAGPTKCRGSSGSAERATTFGRASPGRPASTTPTFALRQVGTLDVWNLLHRMIGYRLAGLADVALTTTDARDHPLAARVLAIRGVDHLHHDRVDAAERDAREGIRLMHDGRSDLCLDPWGTLFAALLFAGRMEEFGDEREALSSAAAGIGDPYLEGVVEIFTVAWLYVANRAAEGLPAAERALAHAREIGNPSLTMQACFQLAGALLDRDPARTRALLLEAIDVGLQVGTDFWVGMALGRLARVDVAAVDPVWARQFRDAIGLAADQGDLRSFAGLLDLLAESLIALGRMEPAAVFVGYTRERGAHGTNPYWGPQAERINAQLVDELGDERVGELLRDGEAMTLADARALAFAELDLVIAEGAP